MRVRGTLGTLNQLTICVGILAALLVNVALPATQWRFMFMLAVVPAVLLALGMLACPDSPRWLASSGQAASAEAAARKLWGPLGPTQLEHSSAASKGAGGAGSDAGSWADLLSLRYRRGVTIGCMLFLFQQFAGINALVYFSTDVFKAAGITSGTLASAAVGATNVIGTLVAASMMESAGRKQLLSNSFVGQGVAMLAMAAGFGMISLKPLSGTIAVAGTLAYIFAFALGAGPVPALMVPELNAAKIRGRAAAAAFGTHWVCNVVIGQTFMAAVAAYGLATVYTLFGAVALLAAWYVNNKVPETKGKTLEQIEAELSGGSAAAGGLKA